MDARKGVMVVITRDLRGVILRAQEGDRAAFDELLEEFYSRVFNLLCKWTGNWHDAEDLTQETFLKAFKYLKSFRIEENFKGWLYKIAVNLAHDYQTDKRASLETAPLDETIQENIEYRSSPEQQIYQRQLLQTVYQVLPELTPRERSVFVLKTMEGLENDEIARVLGISQTTVRRFYGLVRQKILKRLERESAQKGNEL